MTRKYQFISIKNLLLFFLIVGVICLPTPSLFSQGRTITTLKQDEGKKEGIVDIDKYVDEKLGGGPNRPSLVTQAVALSALSLLPFIIMILTSFMKIVIVLSLLRNALGVQNAPPNQIINGVAVMLTLFIMYPTVAEMYNVGMKASEQLKAPDSLVDKGSSTYIIKMADVTKEPLRQFLIRNSNPRHRALFYNIAVKVIPEKDRVDMDPDNFIVVVPAYITSQLKDAFEIGVLIYIPFFVIDLVTSNILLAMGMMMLSPVTISMPLKLFLLVMLDGWTLLIQGLVNTFR